MGSMHLMTLIGNKNNQIFIFIPRIINNNLFLNITYENQALKHEMIGE